MDSGDQYLELVSKKETSEAQLQAFLEQHSELIPVDYFRLGHGIRLNSVITQFPLDTALVTDFAYLTKDSGTWRIVLIELEPANFPLYTNSIESPQPTADFTARLTQIETWKIFVEKRGAEVAERLRPLMKVFPTDRRDYEREFKFVLIVGRAESLKNDRARESFERKSDSDTLVMTHDSLVSWYKYDHPRRRNVLRLEKTHFVSDYYYCPCFHTFDSVKPTDLVLSQKQIQRLERHGFEMEKWKNGKTLDSLGKEIVGIPAVSTAEVSALHRRLEEDNEGV